MKCDFYLLAKKDYNNIVEDGEFIEDEYVMLLNALGVPEYNDIDGTEDNEIMETLSKLYVGRNMEGQFSGDFNSFAPTLDDVKSWLVSRG